MSDETMPAPSGVVGPDAGRDPGSGRFTPGNRAALVSGEHSRAFWEAAEAARRELRDGAMRDRGHGPEDAPTALYAVCDGLAQSILVRDSCFARILESGGPLTSSSRGRRAFTAWQQAADRVEKHARLLGLRRQEPAPPSLDAYLEAHAAATARTEDEP